MSNEKSEHEKGIKLSQDFDAFSRFLENVNRPQTGEEKDFSEDPLHSGATDTFGNPVTFLHPQTAHPLSPAFLQSSSIEVLDLLKTKDLTLRNLEDFTAPVALPGNILACQADGARRGVRVDVARKKEDTWLLEAGSHVRRDSSGNFIAERYGFVVIKGSQISIMSPLRVDLQALRLEWIVTTGHPAGLEQDMLESWINEMGVTTFDHSAMLSLIIKNAEGNLAAGVYKLIEGVPPIPGRDGQITWNVENNRISGEMLADGRIDFREQKFVTNVTAGQILAEVHPGTEGVDGRDIFGKKLASTGGKKIGFIAGKNVRKTQSESSFLFIAEIDGAISIGQNKIEVFNTLTHQGDVNFETGNINFSGSIIIRGAVRNGFTVKASGDIFVSGGVENNAQLKADGHIVVGGLISGKGTVIKAGLSVKAHIVNEATIYAGNDIELYSYAYFAKLRALGAIKVNKSRDMFGGGIVGGETWATEKIDAYKAGTEAWVKTELIAGILPEQVKRMDELKREISNKSLHLRQILDYFGLVEIDLKQLQKKIEAAEGIDRQRMAIRAKTLASTGKLLQNLLRQKKQLTAEIGPAPENAQIYIREAIYPNVTISLGSSRREQKEKGGPLRFFLLDKKAEVAWLDEQQLCS